MNEVALLVVVVALACTTWTSLSIQAIVFVLSLSMCRVCMRLLLFLYLAWLLWNFVSVFWKELGRGKSRCFCPGEFECRVY